MNGHHQHDWRPSHRQGDPHPWQCTECQETSATCTVCDQASGRALLICERCQRREEHILSDIDRIMIHDDGGGVDWETSRGIDLAVARRGSGVDDRDRTPPPTVHSRLHGWVARWTEHAGAANTTPTDYLRSRILWAVHNPNPSEWERYRGDIRSIRAHALAAAGLAPRPLIDRCMHCDGRLVQDRADKRGIPYADGLQDEVRCTRCGLSWRSPHAARLAARQRVHTLPDHEPDALVTLEQARQIWPMIPIETMRSWVKRDRRDHAASIRESDTWDDHWTDWLDAGNVGPIPEPPEFYDRQLPERGKTESGRTLWRLGDLDAYATRRADEDRPGRRAG